jgi:hypothetical protein
MDIPISIPLVNLEEKDCSTDSPGLWPILLKGWANKFI